MVEKSRPIPKRNNLPKSVCEKYWKTAGYMNKTKTSKMGRKLKIQSKHSVTRIVCLYYIHCPTKLFLLRVKYLHG